MRLVLLLLLLASLVEARSNFTGYSGAPGRQTCAISCHGGAEGTVGIQGFPALYEPGATYLVLIESNGFPSINNFNASCRLGTGTQLAGELAPFSGTALYSTEGEANGIRLSSYNQSTAGFLWTAPDSGSGEARLYVGAFQGTSVDGQTTALEILSQEGLGRPELVLDDWQIVEDDDGDGVAEPGEQISLLPILRNTGSLRAEGIVVQASSESPWISWIENALTCPDMGAGASGACDSPLVLLIDAEAPALAEIPIALALSCDSLEFEDALSLQIGNREVLASWDLEDGAPGWSHFGVDEGANDWHLSTEDSQSPSTAWKFGDTGGGDYSDSAHGRLICPETQLPEFALLHFRHRMEAETSSTWPDSAYDGGFVELSSDDGFTWVQLTPREDYPAHFRYRSGGGSPASHPFAGGTPCYSGEHDWREASFDLREFAGQNVRIAFRFGSDTGTTAEGWYIDDIRLLGLPGVAVDGSRVMQPQVFALLPARPNPFNGQTWIPFRLERSMPLTIAIYDLAGRRVGLLHEGEHPAGEGRVAFGGARLASGFYTVRVTTPFGQANQKLLLLK